MTTLDSLTKADLEKVMRSKSLSRARGYINRVQEAVRTGTTLTARISGSGYQIEVEVDGGIHAHCSCPYDWGGYCKHIGAVLLKWMKSPSTFIEVEAPPATDEFPIRATPVEPPPTRRPQAQPFWLTTSLAERQQADQADLLKWLDMHKIQDLRDLAKEQGWAISGTRKADIAQQMFEYMTNPAQLFKVVQTLDDEHRQVFLAMVLLGNERHIQAKDLKRVAEGWGPITTHEEIETYTDKLYQQGLAMVNLDDHGYPRRLKFVPRVLIRHLPPLLTLTIPSTTEADIDPVDGELCLADPLELVRAAYQLIVMLEQNPVALRPPLPRPHLVKYYAGLANWDYDPYEIQAIKQQGGFQSRTDLTLKVPPPALPLPDEAIERLGALVGGAARLEFIYALLVATGLFYPGSPTTVWPEVKEQFLRRNELTQRAILARVYFQMSNWSDLWLVLRAEQDLQLRRLWTFVSITPDQLRADLVRFRQIVLRVLACLPDDEWVQVNDLYALLKIVWPHFDKTAAAPYQQYHISTGYMPGWFLARRNSTQPLSTEGADWKLAQWNFILQMLTGPLHWLGLVDFHRKNGVLVAIRLHGLSDLYWDRQEAPSVPQPTAAQPPAEPAAPDEIVTVDQHTIRVDPSAIAAEAHNLLDKIAYLDEITSEQFTYILSGQAVHASFEAGLTLADMLDDWASLMPLSMPEAIRNQLTAWWQAYGQVRVYEDVTVIEFSDDYTLAEMKAVTSLEQHLIAEISPRLVLIPEEAMEPLVAELEQAGYTPKQTDRV